MEYAAGRKTDYLVAEHVMDIYQQGAMIILPNGEKVRRYVWVETETGGQQIDNADECVPCYSTDIAAAFSVIYKFENWHMELVGGRWVVTITVMAGDYQYISDSFCLAICLAALKAVGYDERHTT